MSRVGCASGEEGECCRLTGAALQAVGQVMDLPMERSGNRNGRPMTCPANRPVVSTGDRRVPHTMAKAGMCG